MSRRDDEFRDKLRALFDSGLPESVQAPLLKEARKFADQFTDSVEWWLTDKLAEIIMGYVEDMADRAIESMLAGNEDMVRRYLSCEKHGYTGRDGVHCVIRGQLFETGGIQLRKQLVNTYADLLKTERILDLEDQVSSLVKQVNQREAELEHLRREMHAG